MAKKKAKGAPALERGGPVAQQASLLLAHLAEIGRLRPLRDPIGSIAPHLTPPQVHCLMWLGTDGPLSSSGVAQRLGCGLPTISGVIDRLVTLGYVERARLATDRRVVQVRLTAAGRKIASALDRTVKERVSLFLAAISPEDRAHVLRILGGIVERLRGDTPSADESAAGVSVKESA